MLVLRRVTVTTSTYQSQANPCAEARPDSCSSHAPPHDTPASLGTRAELPEHRSCKQCQKAYVVVVAEGDGDQVADRAAVQPKRSESLEHCALRRCAHEARVWEEAQGMRGCTHIRGQL